MFKIKTGNTALICFLILCLFVLLSSATVCTSTLKFILKEKLLNVLCILVKEYFQLHLFSSNSFEMFKNLKHNSEVFYFQQLHFIW